jgi:hypothetical protein
MTKFDTIVESVLVTDEMRNSLCQFIMFEYSKSYEDLCMLNESKVHGALKKAGLHLKKQKGLLDYILKAGKTFYNLFKAAMMKDKKKVKEILNTEISKEDLMDFILKLDQSTLHLLTGPLHFIEAVTGWHLAADVDSAVQGVGNVIKTAYQTIVDTLKNAGIIPKNKIDDLKLKDLKQIAV